MSTLINPPTVIAPEIIIRIISRSNLLPLLMRLYSRIFRPTLPLIFGILAAALLNARGESASPGITIALIGDSTVANYAATDSKRGWGQELPRLFKTSAKIENLALNGRSTKTFRETPNWPRVLELKPDFLFIQFGHNDSHSGEKHIAPNGPYTDNLKRYIEDARALNISPILVTPMHRRKYNEAGVPTTELKPYADAMKAVGKEMNVPVIDLYTMSGSLFQKLGLAGTADFFDGTDRTHFAEKGAIAMAELVAQGCAQNDQLKPYLLKVEE